MRLEIAAAILMTFVLIALGIVSFLWMLAGVEGSH